MAGILKVDQIQNTAGVNIMDLQNDKLQIWNGSGYSDMSTPGALIGIQVYTSQDGTWSGRSTSGGSGTWTKPSGCNHVLVYVTGGGGGARCNDNSYRGAGGGGGATGGVPSGSSFAGGAGGMVGTAGLDATQSTGGGGGGVGGSDSQPGGSGGSGIVLLAYPT